jgi:hypothetical protein
MNLVSAVSSFYIPFNAAISQEYESDWMAKILYNFHLITRHHSLEDSILTVVAAKIQALKLN